MKRIILFIAFMFISTGLLFAHPGRTAKDGCHVCKTNCEKWGVNYGEKHCH